MNAKSSKCSTAHSHAKSRREARFKFVVAGPTVLMTILGAGPVRSETSDASSLSVGTTAATQSALSEIIVTAEKRSERLQDVPIQITALTTQTLLDAGVTNTQEALSLVPNVVLDRGGSYRSAYITMRGLSEIDNADPPVAVVLDGVQLTDPRLLNTDFFDVQQVEVVKGPQGALYGRNAVGGAIIISTQPPTNTLHAYGDLTYGNGNTVDVTAGASGPIIKDKVLFRLSADARSSDGLFDETYLHTGADFINHDDTVRGELQLLPTDNLTVSLRADYNNYNAGATYFSVTPNANTFPLPTADLPSCTFGDVTDVTAKVDYKNDFGTVTSITSYTKQKEISRADLDFRNPVNLPGGLFGSGFQFGQGQNQNTEYSGEELRFVSRSDQRFRYLFGVYYQHAHIEREEITFIDLNGNDNQVNNPALYAGPPGNEDDHNNAYAGFLQADYDLLSNLTVTGGLRYDSDQRKQINLANGTDRTATFDRTQPKVTLSYKPVPDTLLYATYGTGFRSGGFNAPGAPILGFAPETLNTYEAGFKTSFLQNRLTVDGAVYQTNVDNYQYFFVSFATGAASQVISNIEQVRIRGVELNVNALLAPGLEFTGGLGTADTDVRQNSQFPGTAGNHTPRTIPVSSTASLSYRHPISDGLTGLARIDWSYYGEKYWTLQNDAVQNPYSLVNLRVGAEHGPYGFYLFSKNVLDAHYYTSYYTPQDSGFDVQFGQLGEPRSYGFEVRAKF